VTGEELERATAALRQSLSEPGYVDALDPQAVQQLLGVAVALYAAKVESAGVIPPFAPGAEPSASEVCVATSQMLDAVSVEIFELALWKSWAGGSK
jgi:hypothetical protein